MLELTSLIICNLSGEQKIKNEIFARGDEKD